MSLATHIEMLQQKHHRLDALLDHESSRPMPDFAVIQTIKKQKLMLKEELERVTDRDRISVDSGA